MKVLLLLSFIVAAQCELCWYYDTILDEDRYFTCYSGCCDDVCCDDYYYYWDGGSIAGATVGSIVGLIVFLAILITVIRICCGYGARGRAVYVRQRGQPTVTVVSSTTATNEVATPYVHYPQPAAPPPYTAHQGVMNPNYAPPQQHPPPQKY